MHQQFSRYAAAADFVDGACIAAAKSYNAMAADSVDGIADAFVTIAWEYEEIDCSKRSLETLRVALKIQNEVNKKLKISHRVHNSPI